MSIEVAKKVLLVGNFGVGKTSLINRYVLNEFSENYISTIGVRVSKKLVKLDDKLIKLMIWDIAGSKGDEEVPTSYFMGASSAMFVVDLNREETHQNAVSRLRTLQQQSGIDRFLIVGNKMDLIDDVEAVKKSISVGVDLTTSAKEGQGVEDAFFRLAELSN